MATSILMLCNVRIHAQGDTAISSADTISRCLPSPLSATFPGSEWDGAPVIGLPGDDTYYPLQKFLRMVNKRTGSSFMAGLTAVVM